MSLTFPSNEYGSHPAAPLTVVFHYYDYFPAGAASVPATTTISSAVIPTHDYVSVALGFAAAGALTCSIAYYLDEDGDILAGTQTLATAATSGVVQTPIGAIFRAIKVSLTNATAAAIAVTDAHTVIRSA